jgi:hypothetical protein
VTIILAGWLVRRNQNQEELVGMYLLFVLLQSRKRIQYQNYKEKEEEKKKEKKGEYVENYTIICCIIFKGGVG